MSAFKQFITNDITIVPFEVNKRFSFSGYAITGSNVGIDVYTGINSTTSLTTGVVYEQNTQGVYNGIKQLYYSNYISSSIGDILPSQSIIPGVNEEDSRNVGPIQSPRYENYLQSSLTQSRYFPTGSSSELSVISIPSKLFGENIVPYTLDINYTSSGGTGYNLTDDGEGNLKIVSSTFSSALYGLGVYGESDYSVTGSEYEVGEIIGQVFYSHGMVVLTKGSIAEMGSEISSSVSNLDNLDISFSSSYHIYENQYRCVINENEFQLSQNKTLLSGSSDDVYYSFATGSTFTPYITTIGLYSNNHELLAIGKLSSPIPVSQHTDTTFIVSFDN